MHITKIKKIIFIGGNRYGENGPLLEFIEECKKNNIDVILFTDQEHLSYATKDMGTFKNAIIKLKIPFEVKESINYESIKQHFDKKNTIIISVNSHIIFKKELIEKVSNNIFNYHNASIPEQKGAACHSWRLMQGIRNCNLTFHKVIEKIDEGKILLEKKIDFPLEAKNLEKSYQFLSNYEKSFFNDFLLLIKTNNKIKSEKKQTKKKEFYWPRLNTEIHGWINWDWNILDIIKFCNAFDSPFNGAATLFDDKEVRFKGVSIDDKDIKFHPFQYGLIYRKDNSHFWVACNGGGLKVPYLKLSKIKNIRLGKRFITPQSKLDNAKAGRT